MRPAFLRLAALAVLAAGAGCADAVDPTLGTEQAFSLYGYLDPTADRQAIRVVPVEATLDAEQGEPLDAVMTATEPATGRTATFRDSVVTYEDGSIGHVFVADYLPTAGTTVKLRVVAPDGGTAAVSVDVPPLRRPEVGPVDVSLTGAVFPILVRDVPRVIGGELRVNVTGLPDQPPGPASIVVPLERLAIRQDGDAWVTDVPFLTAVRAHLRDLGLFNAGVELVTAEFRPFVADAAWAVPPGGFDLDRIVEPGTFSNVDGGFGFVGAGYAAPVQWVPSANVQSLAGFLVVNDPAALVAFNEIGDGYVELFNPTQEGIDLGGYLLADVPAAGAESRVTIPAATEIAPGGFLVVEGPFGARAGTAVQYRTGSGRLLNVMFVESDEPAWGAYPDGFSYQMPMNGPNLFHGPVAPSRGATNRPLAVLAVINEVSASGGFVEVVRGPDVGLIGPLAVGSSPETLGFFGVEVGGAFPFRSASEDGRGLVLDQLGGAAFLLHEGRQVIDARFYGPQAPERSAGYLPDGASGDWTDGLRPTRGAANALARFLP